MNPGTTKASAARSQRYGAYEARRAEANNSVPPTVTLGDPAQEAVAHVAEAVKRTKRQVAIAWLQDVLKDGPVAQKEIEATRKPPPRGPKGEGGPREIF